VKAGLRRHLGRELDVAPEIVGARVDHAADAAILKLHDLVGADADHLGALRPAAEGVGFPAGKPDDEVLVHQRRPELIDVDRPGHRMDHSPWHRGARG